MSSDDATEALRSEKSCEPLGDYGYLVKTEKDDGLDLGLALLELLVGGCDQMMLLVVSIPWNLPGIFDIASVRIKGALLTHNYSTLINLFKSNLPCIFSHTTIS